MEEGMGNFYIFSQKEPFHELFLYLGVDSSQ